jgi:hypothetical protein
MTQQRAKDAIDGAFAAEIEKLFANFVSNLVGQPEHQATAEFTKGFDTSVRAHAIAMTIAEKVLP